MGEKFSADEVRTPVQCAKRFVRMMRTAVRAVCEILALDVTTQKVTVRS
jgi:hypothetical protein